MSLSGFRKAGHPPTLLAAFLYFDVSFMIWVLLGPLGPFIGDALHLTATQKGFIIAIPLLGGSLFRPLLGALADRIGGRRVGLLGMTLTFLPLLAGWKLVSGPIDLALVGFLLGIAGASFAVALPLASRWYPPEHQGLAMGIAGAGNSGTLLATLFAPRLAQAFGWPNVLAAAMIPLAAVWVVFFALAKDAPARSAPPAWRDYVSALREPDTAWFSLFYSITFGGFVGLASFLTLFFHEQYGLAKVTAGDYTTAVVLAGSFLRPVGGMIADRIGGYRLLLCLLVGAACCLSGVAALPPVHLALALLVLTTAMLGMGNGAIFQILPQRFPRTIGILTGVVGAAGGVGGFLLPSLLGVSKDRFGTYGAGLLICAAAVLGGAALLLILGSKWRSRWNLQTADRAGVFCIRSVIGSRLGIAYD